MNGQRQFGPYRLIRQIAVGGMAEIHLAKTEGLAGFEKYVAIKMIHPNFSQDENFIQMLIDEAKISVQLQHVNVAQTFDLGRVGDTYYITMEYVDGADLYKLLRRASEKDIDMPVDVAAYIAKEMANGLDYAHRRRGTDGQPLGIVHRDVSPQNVLISHAGEVKLVDFGIAKATMKARQTAVGVIKGKYYYMSPEQAWGDPVDHRTDIFSMGILLYEALTGQMLYLEEDLNRLMDMVRKANIQSPRRLRSDIPPQLERIVMHALKKRREDRYQTAGDMATDLERFLHVYSPVFRSGKVSEFFKQVLEEEPPPPTAEREVVYAEPPSTVSQRIAVTDLLRERAEFSDENSVIFRVSEMRPDAGKKPAEPRKASDSTRPIPDVDQRHMSFISDLDNIEEQTVISGPPGFAAGPDFAQNDDYEPTFVESGASELDDADEDGPTMNHTAARQPRPEAGQRNGPRASAPAKKPSSGKRARPAHPALAAKTPLPAVSALGTPRKSRKTPAKGVAAPPPPPGQSLISTLVGAGDAPEPVRRESPPAATEKARQAHLPLQAPPHTPIPGPLPIGPSAGNGQAAHGTGPTPGGHGTGPTPGGHGTGPTPGGHGTGPTPGGHGTGLPPAIMQAPDPFSPLPQGVPPQSMTRQLQAMVELEAIPDHYKIARQKPRWLLRLMLIVVCVAGGVGIGVALFASSGDDRAVTVEIGSMPQGARVQVNGQALPETTPLLWTEAEIGTRYQLVFELEGYNPRTKEVLVNDHAEEVVVVLDPVSETVILSVQSEPDEAEIFIDGKSYGRTARRITGLEPESATTLELRMPGYHTHREELDWSEERELARTVTLRKK